MKKILVQFATFALCAAMLLPGVGAAKQGNDILQVGLAYGSGALKGANLQNETDFGSGYRFGYFDEELQFEELGYTDEEVNRVTVLKTQNTWFYYDQSSQSYVYANSDNGGKSVGCFHIQLPETFDEFDEALEYTGDYENGFVAWIDGEYQVRVGAFLTKDDALAELEELDEGEVVGTSSYAVTVVATGTDQILFQFDGGEEYALGILPDVTEADDVHTWFKGFKYRGGFRYERIGGGDLTVVNIVDMDTYIKGVIPYEMNNNWPLEALKAQAVCARSYAYNSIQEQSHKASHFDICTTEDCQVYRGVGAGNVTYRSNERTDQAVDETSGMYALYDGTPIIAYYSSCHGGASERIDRVQNSSFAKYPYICGVIDPYEHLVDDINPMSSWKKTYTADELTQRLRARGFASGTTVQSLDLTYSEFGNVIKVKVNYSNGKSNTFTPKNDWGVRSLFGVSSLHFTVNGQKPEVETVTGQPAVSSPVVNEQEQLDLESKLYVITGTGRTARIDPEEIYVITGSGTKSRLELEEKSDETVPPPAVETTITVSGSKYVVEGSGNGHQMGMSQYGAYAMAEEGFTYDQIVEFYYPGVEVDTY